MGILRLGPPESLRFLSLRDGSPEAEDLRDNLLLATSLGSAVGRDGGRGPFLGKAR